MFEQGNFPENNPGNRKDDELNHWAHLEAKSECMAEELAQRARPSGVFPSVKQRLSCLCTLVVLIAIFGLAILAARYLQSNSVEKTSPKPSAHDVVRFRP